MRQLSEVETEFTLTCAHLGKLEVDKTKVLEQLEVLRAPLLKKVDELQKEADQIKAVQAELDKVAEAMRKPTEETAVAVVVPSGEVSNEQAQTE